MSSPAVARPPGGAPGFSSGTDRTTFEWSRAARRSYRARSTWRMKEFERSEQPRWLNRKPIKEINRVLRARPERRRGWGQRVFSWERRSGGSTRDEADGGYRIGPLGRKPLLLLAVYATARRRADNLVASATPVMGNS